MRFFKNFVLMINSFKILSNLNCFLFPVLKSRMEKAMKMAPGLIDILPEPKPEVPFLILPDNLNVTMLKYPRLRDLETQRLYALCHTKGKLYQAREEYEGFYI